MFNDNKCELAPDERPDWIGSVPFIAVHLTCLSVLWTGSSWAAWNVALLLYVVRMFFVTGFFHRYFSHRTYKLSRWLQCVAAFCATTAVQKGPIWWASHHRPHHKYSDTPQDVHSAKMRTWFWAHCGWVLCRKYQSAMLEFVPDLNKFPELRFFETRFGNLLGPVLLAVGCFTLGELAPPSWQTSGIQMLVIGFFCSTVALFHGTFFINSWAHTWGTQRFATGDESRNNFWLALITLGEGWHNNHHADQYESAQRRRWWEIDQTHYLLVIASWLHLLRFVRKNAVTVGDRVWAAGHLAAALLAAILVF